MESRVVDGPRVAAALLEFLIIMSFGYLVYEVVSLYVNSKLAAEQTASGYDPDSVEVGGDGGGAGGSRLSTVLPLILGVARVTIIVVFLLLGLSNIGIDTTPLLAGAGIGGGHVYGKSNKYGEYPTSNPVRPEELAATIYHALGIPETAAWHDDLNRPHHIYHGQPIPDLLG